MKPAPSPPTAAAHLLALVHELLDAHADTIEISDGADDLRWDAHLDYLRALQRKAKEILAA